MRAIKYVAIRLPILMVRAVCVPLAFLIPEYRQLVLMGTTGVGIFFSVDQALPRMPVEDLTRCQTNLVIWVGTALALAFTLPIISSWAAQPVSIGYAVMGIVARPLLNPLLETALDWKLRDGRLHNLELATGRCRDSAPKLLQLAKSSPLAEAVYSSVLLAIALTMVLAQVQTALEPVEQSMAVSLVVIVVCPLPFHLHPHRRDLREYVTEAKGAPKSTASRS